MDGSPPSGEVMPLHEVRSPPPGETKDRSGRCGTWQVQSGGGQGWRHAGSFFQARETVSIGPVGFQSSVGV